MERKIVIPGEVIVKGDSYLPGDWTEKKGEEIIAIRYGLAEEQKRLIKVIPLSGVYSPRVGNVIIGRVEDLTLNGWIIDIGASQNAFLQVSEVPRYVAKGSLDEVLDIGDMLTAKIIAINKRGIDLTIRARSFGKIGEGLILKINSNKVPRVIGKEGSMVKLIKEETGCSITVGQNGYIWIRGKTVENELEAKDAILFVAEKSFISGLTEEIKDWFKKRRKELSSKK